MKQEPGRLAVRKIGEALVTEPRAGLVSCTSSCWGCLRCCRRRRRRRTWRRPSARPGPSRRERRCC